MIEMEIIQAIGVGLHAGERCLVFNNDAEIVNYIPYYHAPQAANLDYAALEVNSLSIFNYLADGHTPIGYGLITEIRNQIAIILFARFPKVKNNYHLIDEDETS